MEQHLGSGEQVPVSVRKTEPPANQETPVNKRRKSVKKPSSALALWIIALVLLVGAASAAGYYYNRYHNSQKEVQRLASNPQQVAQDQSKQLIAKIGLLTQLPAGETPTVATVTDITKLKDQLFFVDAQNGDRVLIYTQAKKAIIYRPSTNKIINIGPVNLGDSSSTGSTTQSTTAKP